MKLQFKPSIWPCLVRLLWLVWPVAVWVLLSFYNVLPAEHGLLDLIIIVGVFAGSFKAAYLNASVMKFDDRGLTVQNKLFGGSFFLPWGKIDRAVIENKGHLFIPTIILTLYYGDRQSYNYYLSELSEADQASVIDYLRLKIVDLAETEF